MMRSTASVGSVSILSEAGLDCSVRSFSSTFQANILTAGRPRFSRLPHALEIHEVLGYFDSGNRLRKSLRRARKFGPVVDALPGCVVIECGEPPVRAAIGVQHQNHAAGAVQARG